MTFDRSKFKGASIEKNKEFTKMIDGMTKPEGSSKRPDYHEIKEGTNVFRICPPHDSEDPSMQAKVTTWLPQRIEEKDKDGKGTGKFEIKDRPIFNSRIHGGTQKDVVEEYINFVYKQVYDEVQDKDERAKKMSPITGYRSKDQKWHPGIKFSTSYVLYAFKEGKLGRLEIFKTDKDEMEKLNIAEDADEPITTDVFSDPDNGVSLIIKLSNENGKKQRIVSKREFNPKKYKTWDEFIESEKITEEQLMELDKQQPLKEIFQNVYKRSDFEKALEGLQIFDEKNKFGIFANDDFLDIVQEIDAYYPEKSIEDEATEKNNSGAADIMDMTRDELKAYIEENDLPIVVRKQMTEDDIRDLIFDAEKEKKESEEVKEKPQTKEETKEEPSDLPWDKEEKKPIDDAKKQKLADLRAKLGKK